MNFFGFGPSAELDIVLDGQESRKTAEIKTEDGKKERHLLYYDGESVSGKVNIQLKKPGSRLDHYGIKIELIGQIELYYDRGNHHDFLSLTKELARPGDLFQHTTYNFEFVNVEKPYESYTGSNVKLRYFLRVTIIRRLSDIVKEKDMVVHTLSAYPEMNSSIKMEVGIEDCLHIEFEYNKSKYHLKDVIVGKIYFLLVRIKIKHMEIAIIKRETTGSGPNTFNENETIAKYEIMDGAPVRGESIPIRVFLAGYDLTPTMKDINKKFSVRYYLNLVLVDEEDCRYFKQQEIVLWRKGEKTRKPFQASLQQQYKQMQNPNVQFASSDQSIGSANSKNPLGNPNVKDENGSGDPSSTTFTNNYNSNRSPLEQDSSSSEQPTPDKEFQSVINSKAINSPTSPVKEDNQQVPSSATQNNNDKRTVEEVGEEVPNKLESSSEEVVVEEEEEKPVKKEQSQTTTTTKVSKYPKKSVVEVEKIKNSSPPPVDLPPRSSSPPPVPTDEVESADEKEQKENETPSATTTTTTENDTSTRSSSKKEKVKKEPAETA